MIEKGRLLIIDDEEVIIDVFQNLLEDKGYVLYFARTGSEALKIFEENIVDLIILDYKLPDMEGDELFKKIKTISFTVPIIVITAYATLDLAVNFMKMGAFDFITKPFTNEAVLLAIEKGIRQHSLLEENLSLKRQIHTYHGIKNIVGCSKHIRDIYNLILQVAPSKATVLIEGESGTGKELVAKAIHDNSLRSDKPFIIVNSGNMPPDLLESNLFGHEKGAFTGAVSAKKGLFEVADGGSIFLDEIGTINYETQIKLLRVIQEKEFMRLGGLNTIKVDVRIIAATNTDLKKAVDDGRFREDLYYRLNVINIYLQPLRNRKEDIPLLADHFIKKYSNENNKKVLRCSPKVIDMFISYDWPGNIRELENVIERAVVLAKGEEIIEELIPEYIIGNKTANSDKERNEQEMNFYKKVKKYKIDLIKAALQKNNGIQKKTAKMLGIKPTTLNEMIKRYGIKYKE